MNRNIQRISDIIPPVMWDFYMYHPVEFVEDLIFGFRAKKHGGKLEITDQQKEVLNAIAHNRRVSVRAGRGVGKTGILSWLCIWWQCMFARARVICTAPSYPQLQSVLWPEVSKWLSESLLSDCFEHTQKRMYLLEDPKNNFSEPRTAAKEESAQGLHEDHMLIMMDEASGIPDNIYDVIQHSMTRTNNKIILMTNPTRVSGFSYDSHHRNKRFWSTHVLNAELSPIVDKDVLKDMRDKYVHNGFVHDMYKIHVLGEYPSGDPDAYIGLVDVEEAQYRGRRVNKYGEIVEIKGIKDGAIEVAIDVARKGADLTCCASRAGNWVFSAQELGLLPLDPEGIKEDLYTKGQTTIPEAINMVWEVVDATRKLTGCQDVIRVKVDDTGVGGGVTDFLELDKEHNIEVIPVNFGGAGDEHYANEASKMWGGLKDVINEIHLPNDRFMAEELATRRWEQDNKERVFIESKKQYKKDFGSSPDRADTIVMLFSDKENERRYVAFNPASNKCLHKSADDMQNGLSFVSLFCSPSQKISAVWSTWFNGNLRIIDEYEGDSYSVMSIIKESRSADKILGSDLMFKKGTDDLALQYMTNGIYVSERFGYDEIGSINHMSRLAGSGKLIVAEECPNVFSQLRGWTANRSKGELREDYGLCYSITLVVSELVSTNKINPKNNVRTQFYSFDQSNKNKDPNIGFMSI